MTGRRPVLHCAGFSFIIIMRRRTLRTAPGRWMLGRIGRARTAYYVAERRTRIRVWAIGFHGNLVAACRRAIDCRVFCRSPRHYLFLCRCRHGSVVISLALRRIVTTSRSILCMEQVIIEKTHKIKQWKSVPVPRVSL
ncbi:hypothetical protein SEVIR_3G252132v4 [Setaria viridis]